MDGQPIPRAAPLMVIDGVVQPRTGSLEDLESGDIERIEIVKGPAARALYGSRARDGVILIETKAGGGRR